ncbi:DNA-directed RNA polymerase subunit omega [Paramaledivibacter caminithermalis]|jgi:DNA-directed RNA polymerase subunit omega|uniref:DNA-directed RNA polymerase subunit omega n=1 Tax=Paramaledivibacter caminithermalis (strain DSM 15212 / CIP 107654 / DViRD3) TaxID=1121301 RepID=A0A1M6NH92_PARC5|nr:DNA-directed RNA polymerase subunit omega [Paramaledivibacter caminithermalis]SHJ94993.1 DNA-directed RNA polymerase subunit omega [Paramaledivibacter caminithermalis DSM 15212]
MLEPSINELLKKVDSRYSLVIATARRARQIIDGSEKLIDIESNKPVTIATNEIMQGKITYKKIEEDI